MCVCVFFLFRRCFFSKTHMSTFSFWHLQMIGGIWKLCSEERMLRRVMHHTVEEDIARDLQREEPLLGISLESQATMLNTPLKMNGWNLKVTQLKRKMIFHPPSFLGSSRSFSSLVFWWQQSAESQVATRSCHRNLYPKINNHLNGHCFCTLYQLFCRPKHWYQSS